jgi:uncharacterized protein (TIGR02246 family)
VTRPRLTIQDDTADEVVARFAAGLQRGHDSRDADILNAQFAADVAWGSPFGALVLGFDELHAIHTSFQARARHGQGTAFRYEVRHVMPVTDGVVVAHIARLALGEDGDPLPPTEDRDAPFSEMAMFVLVRRNDEWWLAAGQHTPMRPGGAAPAETSRS